jgi:excisionase family DNA binding protein
VNENRDFITIPQLAKIMGISRISVYKKVKSGEIKAAKIGRNYAISREFLKTHILGQPLSETEKKEIDSAIKKTVQEYAETLKRLGKE